MFAKKLMAGWGDMDFNSHMRNTAFLDKAGDVRMLFLSEHGFPMSEFMRLKIGPVVMKDEIAYVKEVLLLEEITVTLSLAGLAEDGSRWILRSDIIRPDGKLAARVNSTGGWLDLGERKLITPPAKLMATWQALVKSDDFQELSSSVKAK
ncbi:MULTISPECIES: thioesterase family protein [unclassified Duganella]|uniref:thioesterase family protein n=1 Tax=unclassified Duganella TaxID=2636909 RepID=UPI00089052BD|nr:MULTISPECIES: thioesterase family protein [unclassified Duganella]SDG64329.1 acyl-CoA thioester hydrolase [Duganella sp. OV458]SDJ89369.1 acyl-CoA thioester hydrolase [Duganella sp. OV510]